MALFESAAYARRFFRRLALVLAVGLLLLLLPARGFRVTGPSMLPILHDSDRILIEELTPRFRSVRRGEVIVFRHPRDPKRLLVKRVIGMGGDTVAIDRGLVALNGVVQDEPYLGAGSRDERSFAPTEVAHGFLYVLGDDRSISEDSRVWGPIPESTVLGRALFTYWPPQRGRNLVPPRGLKP